MELDKPVFYTTGHIYNERMWRAFESGFNAVRANANSPLRIGYTSAFYGILRGTGDRMLDAERLNEDYLYCDHSYFAKSRVGPESDYFGGYFRIVPNGRYYAPHMLQMPDDRFQKLGIELKPWKKEGEYILVCPVSRHVAALEGFNAQTWMNDVCATLHRCTDRRVVVKPKDSDVSLESVLGRAWALVTMDSNAAIDAAVAGVPVFCSVRCAAAEVGNIDLRQIESPKYPDRLQHFSNLAYSQFTYEEITSGYAQHILSECGHGDVA
jgi:hypothetical protein